MATWTSVRRAWRLQLFWLVPTIVGALGMAGRLPWHTRLVVQAVMWFSWSLPTLAVFATWNRWPVTRATALASTVRFAALGVAAIAWQVFISVSAWTYVGLMTRPLWSSFTLNMRAQGDVYTVIYLGILAAYAALRAADRWREESVRSALVREDLMRAQLQALRAQLNPHFLFNTLASIVSQIGRDRTSAERTVVALADLLRKTLALAEHQEISVLEEIDLVRGYLGIEQTRFSDRLRLDWTVDERALALMVPALTLQPLVENALVHGISQVTDDGVVSVQVQLHPDGLQMTVLDNGPGPTRAAPSEGPGIGLRNLRERLQRLYGDFAVLTVEDADADVGGCRATVTLPAHQAGH